MAGAMTGIKLLDFSQIVSGPMAACILADQGADVIKLEAPSGDPVRAFGPGKGNMSATYITVNRGKRGLALDLKKPESAAIVAALIGWADVLIENFRPGAMERLGYGAARCAEINPRLIYASVSGFGPDGPYRNIRVYDPAVQAVSGIAATQLDAAGHPSLVASLMADKLTALTAAQAITAALFARERTGVAQQVAVSMLDAAIAFNWPEAMYNHSFLDDPPAPLPNYSDLARLWPARDGQVAIGVLQDAEFVALCAAIERPDLAADPRFTRAAGRALYRDDWLPAVATEIASRDVDTLMAAFIATGAVGGRVNTRANVGDDPQVRHNRSIAEIDHGALGRVRSPIAPARFSATPSHAPRPAPGLGEHSRAILQQLGRSPADIDALITAGVVIAASP